MWARRRWKSSIRRLDAGVPGIGRATGRGRAASSRPTRGCLGIWQDTGNTIAFRRYDILDPKTYRYLGTRTVLLRDEVMPGHSDPAFRKDSVWATALLSSVIVDRPVPGEKG
jgi:hypothetical protein